MNKKAFTLVEIIVSLAILTVLLMFSFSLFIRQTSVANNFVNKEVDIQEGVASTMDKVKVRLKKSTQVHLVGDNVYQPGMDLSKLDERYSYIGMVDFSGNRVLADIKYDETGKKWETTPLVSIDRVDTFNNQKLLYDMAFYEGDTNYKAKLDNKVLNITVKGKWDMAGTSSEAKSKDFILSEDIALGNTYQVLLSRHLNGGVENITAIAYDDNQIVGEKKKKTGKTAVVLILDYSGSMSWSLHGDLVYYQLYDPHGNNYKVGTKHEYTPVKEQYKTKEKLLQNIPPRKHIVGDVLVNQFLPAMEKIDTTGDKMEFYIYNFTRKVQYSPVSPSSSKYFWLLDDLSDPSKGNYGPYFLKDRSKMDNRILNECGMLFNEHNGYGVNSGGTNTGEAILQGLEIMNQLKEKGIKNRFLILLTDGHPTVYSVYKWTNYFATGRDSTYSSQIDRRGDNDSALNYVKAVGEGSQNQSDSFTKAFLIGFSANPWEKKRLADTQTYLAQAGGKVETYDSASVDQLISAFDDISVGIAKELNIFDGPDKMK